MRWGSPPVKGKLAGKRSAEPYRALQSLSKDRAGQGMVGLGWEPDTALPSPFPGHGRAWLGWAGSPTEPGRALSEGMVGHGRAGRGGGGGLGVGGAPGHNLLAFAAHLASWRPRSYWRAHTG